MASKSLDGSMVPRNVARRADHRCEPRFDAGARTAVLHLRGRKHSVELANLSASGAMIIFSLIPYIGQTIRLELGKRGQVSGSVCWVRNGKIGVTFSAPLE
jgi:hypothetical protein